MCGGPGGSFDSNREERSGFKPGLVVREAPVGFVVVNKGESYPVRIGKRAIQVGCHFMSNEEFEKLVHLYETSKKK